MAKIDYLFISKTAEKSYRLGPHIPTDRIKESTRGVWERAGWAGERGGGFQQESDQQTRSATQYSVQLSLYAFGELETVQERQKPQ